MFKGLLTNPTVQSVIAGQIRHAAGAIGAALATSGFIGGSEVEKFTGAATVLLVMLWSAIAKRLG